MNRNYRLTALLTAIFILSLVSVISAQAQQKEVTPELSVVGVELGNRQSAKNYFLPGHTPRAEDDGRASYYFYNEWGTQVMRLVVASVDDPYFITEIEVFAVGEQYQKKHYQDAKNGLLITENGIFIGFRQTVMNLIVGIRNAGKKNTIGPGGLVDIKGEPSTRESVDEVEVITYDIPSIKVADSETPVQYTSRFEFKKKKLKRFSLKIELESGKLAQK